MFNKLSSVLTLKEFEFEVMNLFSFYNVLLLFYYASKSLLFERVFAPLLLQSGQLESYGICQFK